MRAPWLSLGAATALLTACGGERTVNNQTAISIANEHHEELLRLSPGRQRLAMRRAILDSRYRCISVDNAGYQEEYRNMRMWVATCGQEQKTFAVYIAANGDVQVRDCADAGTLSLPRCKGLPPAVADPTMPEFKDDASDEAFKNGS
jgi:hypothetical protein